MLELLTILFVLGCLYFLPFIIALCRNHNINGIFLVNFLAGWTLIGWILALAMACGESRAQQVVYVKEKVVPVKAHTEQQNEEEEDQNE